MLLRESAQLKKANFKMQPAISQFWSCILWMRHWFLTITKPLSTVLSLCQHTPRIARMSFPVTVPSTDGIDLWKGMRDG
jgi:hypothetical protein